VKKNIVGANLGRSNSSCTSWDRTIVFLIIRFKFFNLKFSWAMTI